MLCDEDFFLNKTPNEAFGEGEIFRIENFNILTFVIEVSSKIEH